MEEQVRELIWTDKASDRMIEIFEWNLKEHGFSRASKIDDSIQFAAEQIPGKPFSYPICEELFISQEHIRNCLVEKTYRIVFEIQDSKVYIPDTFMGP